MGYITEERQMIIETARDFTNNVVLPNANALDPEKGAIPREMIKQMGELGFFGIKAPERYGGSDMGCFEYCLIAEELCRGWMSVGSIIARAQPTLFEGTSWPQEKQQEYAQRSTRGDFLVAVALSEPNVGSDLSSIACKAKEDGDDYVLSGNKYWCTFADGADAILVFARTSPRSEDPRKAHLGISALLVEKPRGELPSNCVGHPIPKIGYFGWNTYELAFDGCRVSKDNLVGEEGKGFLQMVSGLETARADAVTRRRP